MKCRKKRTQNRQRADLEERQADVESKKKQAVSSYLAHGHETRSVGRPRGERQAGVVVAVAAVSVAAVSVAAVAGVTSVAAVSAVLAVSASPTAVAAVAADHSAVAALRLRSHVAYCKGQHRGKNDQRMTVEVSKIVHDRKDVDLRRLVLLVEF